MLLYILYYIFLPREILRHSFHFLAHKHLIYIYVYIKTIWLKMSIKPLKRYVRPHARGKRSGSKNKKQRASISLSMLRSLYAMKNVKKLTLITSRRLMNSCDYTTSIDIIMILNSRLDALKTKNAGEIRTILNDPSFFHLHIRKSNLYKDIHNIKYLTLWHMIPSQKNFLIFIGTSP